LEKLQRYSSKRMS